MNQRRCYTGGGGDIAGSRLSLDLRLRAVIVASLLQAALSRADVKGWRYRLFSWCSAVRPVRRY